MARILVLTQFFPPETGAAANRIGAMTDTLSTQHQLEVVTLEPSYPEPGLFAQSVVDAADRSRAYTIERTFAFKPHHPSLVVRSLKEIWMGLRLALWAWNNRADAVIVSTPSMFLGPLAWLLARAKRAAFVWDVRDFTWRYARESVKTSRVLGVVTAALERFMWWNLSKADLIVSATPGLTDIMLEQGLDAHKIVTVSNGVSRSFLDLFPEDETRASNARPRVSYVGLFGYNHGISILLDVAKRLPNVDFVLVGDGPERELIQTRIQNEDIQNVTLRGYVTDRAEVARVYLGSDVLVNHTKDAPTLNRTINPAKVFEYLASRRPVVYAGKGLAAEFLERQGMAVVVPPQDPDAFADAIRALLENPEQMRDIATRGRRYVEEHYCREVLLERLLEAVNVRLNSKKSVP